MIGANPGPVRGGLWKNVLEKTASFVQVDGASAGSRTPDTIQISVTVLQSGIAGG
jgi:hypothetical protein